MHVVSSALKNNPLYLEILLGPLTKSPDRVVDLRAMRVEENC